MPNLTKVKSVKNAELFKDEKDQFYIKIQNVRFSYPHIAKPFKGKNDKGEDQSKYGVKAMLPYPTHREAFNLVTQVIADMLKANKGAVSPATRSSCVMAPTWAMNCTWSIGLSRPTSRNNRRPVPRTTR